MATLRHLLTAPALACAMLLASSRALCAEPDPFAEQVVPFLSKYCYDCHSGDGAEAGIDLSARNSLADAQASRARWNQIRGLIKLRAMPPEDHDPLPAQEELAVVVETIDRLLNRADCDADNDPGRVTMRRLNAVEYDNTVRDLLGIDFRPSQFVGLPSDDVGNGFDNQGEVLSVTPLLLEKYLDAAAEISRRAVEADRERPAEERRLLVVDLDQGPPREAARAVFAALLPRVYRRAVDPNEVERLVDLAMGVGGDERLEGVRLGLQAALMSPHFLFRVEQPASGAPRPLEGYELANRVSYFLWASMPDDKLFAAAAEGALSDDRKLRNQVKRMLDEPGADTLITRFCSQWLGLTGLDQLSPDLKSFPNWNTRLREAMREETFRLCRQVFRRNRSLLDLFDAEYTYLNPRLAELYGENFLGQDPRDLYLKGPGYPQDKERRKGPGRGGKYLMEDRWIRVPAPPGRRGVMTHASVLALTSNPSSSSPVKRGRWVLDIVLGDSPPPAPPTVPSLEETAAGAADRPLREQLAVHRQNPSCASCHEQMDPIGLGLQNYDAIGRWRLEQGGHTIDPSGELNGRAFETPLELMDIVRQREEDIVRNFVKRLMVYALGRGLRPADLCAVDEIVAQAEPKRYRVSDLILGVVMSDPFRKTGLPEIETP